MKADDWCRELIGKYKSKRAMPPQTSSVVCRDELPEDSVLIPVGTIVLRRLKDKVTYKVSIKNHYFYSDSVIFEKKSKGRLGFRPHSGLIKMWETDVISFKEHK